MQEILDVVGKTVSGAAIFSHDGTVMCTTSGFHADIKEFRVIASLFEKKSPSVYSGMFFQNARYAFTSLNNNVAIAENSSSIIVIVRNNSLCAMVYDNNRKWREKLIGICQNLVNQIDDFIIKEDKEKRIEPAINKLSEEDVNAFYEEVEKEFNF